MPYTIVKTLGTTGRQYSTLDTWADACPADLTDTKAGKYTASTFSGSLTLGETVTGGTSGKTGVVLETDNSTYVVLATVSGVFTNGETMTGGTSGKTFVITTTGQIQGLIWRGECYHDAGASSDFTAGITWNAITTSSTCYVELTAATGQSFCDNANVRTNALRYNPSNGASVSVFTAHSAMFSSGAPLNFHISRLQLEQGSVGGFNLNPIRADNLLLHNLSSGQMMLAGNVSAIWTNILAIVNSNSNPSVFSVGTGYGGNNTLIGCVAVRCSDKTVGGAAFGSGAAGNTNTVESCASFGFTTPISASGFSTSKNNATDQASWGAGGTGNQTSVTYNATTPFTQAASTGSLDFRPIASTALAGNGFKDATNAPNDISGTARASSPTIGVWELVSSTPFLAPQPYVISQAVRTAAFWSVLLAVCAAAFLQKVMHVIQSR